MSAEQLVHLVNVQIVPISLFLIMLGMGLSLVPDDFRRVLAYPKAVAIGLSCQLVLLPLIGFGLANLVPLAPELAVGVMLLVVCPGGTTSNLYAHIAKGDVALSVTLTAVASVVTVFSIPFIVNGSLLHFMGESEAIKLPIGRTMVSLVLLTIIPISIGMTVRRFKPVLAIAVEQRVKYFAVIFLALLIAFLVYQQRETFADSIISAGPVALLLNVSTMLIGFYGARLFALNRQQSISITLETGLQNSGLSMVLALGMLNNYAMSLVPAIYTGVMFITAGVLVYYLNRSKPSAVGVVGGDGGPA
ncbi:bile acid:sodium symporter [Marinobacter psychrophilus]|jgi:BASS family bile acid:Na+ symporter|uniref:Bile acid:sodium symporter n=1 Tax=Marinobacter psychrophilus TaxID=330734 RepID=A0A0H4HYQ3_9GAMM|nr:bile acid:sodium symporter family protein [Marinobacter psychrophilus]AKO51794.1 bile acid:sodium symporter [Marinobacter psychrophilus]